MCRVLGVSPSGYHAWTRRSPSRRAREDAVLRDRIVAIHVAAHGTYVLPAFTPSLQPRASTWAASAWRGSCALRAWLASAGAGSQLRRCETAHGRLPTLLIVRSRLIVRMRCGWRTSRTFRRG